MELRGLLLAPSARDRRLFAAGLAVVVTFALFYLMHALSFLRATPIQQENEFISVTLEDVLEDTDAQNKRRQVARPKKAAPPPTPDVDLTPPRPNFDNVTPQTIGVPPASVGGFGAGLSDMDAVPLVRIQPEYPRRAAELNLKGWVHLRFTVTTLGTTKDISVVDSEPPRTFDRAAMRAVRKFKYRPKVIDGTPVEQYGVEIVITFDGVEEVE